MSDERVVAEKQRFFDLGLNALNIRVLDKDGQDVPHNVWLEGDTLILEVGTKAHTIIQTVADESADCKIKIGSVEDAEHFVDANSGGIINIYCLDCYITEELKMESGRSVRRIFEDMWKSLKVRYAKDSDKK